MTDLDDLPLLMTATELSELLDVPADRIRKRLPVVGDWFPPTGRSPIGLYDTNDALQLAVNATRLPVSSAA